MKRELLLSLLVAIACCLMTSHALLAQQPGAKKKVVFVAGTRSHSYGAHEHNAGCLLLAKELQAAMPNVTCDVQQNGWPEDAHFFDGAGCLVMYCDGGAGHMANKHLDEIDALAKK